MLLLFKKTYPRDSRVPTYEFKKDILRVLLGEHQLLPSHCAMIGDTIENASSFAANQIDIALMEYGYGHPLLTHPVWLRMSSFLNFPPYLATENAK